jgi:energy-converting hydrogenase Eha subunit C
MNTKIALTLLVMGGLMVPLCRRNMKKLVMIFLVLGFVGGLLAQSQTTFTLKVSQAQDSTDISTPSATLPA